MEKILSDHGVNFEANLLKHLCFLCGTDKLHSTTYHPMGNGLAERMMKTLKPGIAKYVNDEHDDWDTFVQLSTSAYNTAYHASTRISPFEAVFGRKPVVLADVILNNQLPYYTRLSDVSKYIIGLRLTAKDISDRIRNNIRIAQARQKANYDNETRDSVIYVIGDQVMINNTKQRVNHSKAFEPKFLGPYRIIKICNELNYVIESPTLGTEIVHYNRLRRFYTRKNDQVSPIERQEPKLDPVIKKTPSSTMNTTVVYIPCWLAPKSSKKRREPSPEVVRDEETREESSDPPMPPLELLKPLIAETPAHVMRNVVSVIDSIATGTYWLDLGPEVFGMRVPPQWMPNSPTRLAITFPNSVEESLGESDEESPVSPPSFFEEEEENGLENEASHLQSSDDAERDMDTGTRTVSNEESVSSTESDEEDELDTHEGQIECGICHRWFKGERGLKIHCGSQHKLASEQNSGSQE
jgi:hypothetical protein